MQNIITTNGHAEAQSLLQDYLKLLYSSSFAETYYQAVDNESDNPLFHVNQSHLDFERGARQRNLFKFFQTASPLFSNFFPENMLREVVTNYCDSENFWQYTGRNLVENFCIYFHEKLLINNNRFGADITKLHGIISGLPLTVDLQSPWKESKVQFMPELSLFEESFYSPFQLVNHDGVIQTEQPEFEQSSNYEIKITIKNKASVEIKCIKVGKINER